MFTRILNGLSRLPLLNFSAISELMGLSVLTLKQLPRLFHPGHWQIFWLLFKRQMYNAGIRAVYINTVIALLVGSLLMTRAYSALPEGSKLGDFYAQFFVIAVVREIGPFVSGVILIARSASAMTFEIGYLKLNKQFETLQMQGMQPAFVFLLPVLLAFPLSLFLMFFFFDVVCMLSANLMINLLHDANLSVGEFTSAIASKLDGKEIVVSLFKSFLGGGLIALVSIYYGSLVHDRFTDISRAISRSLTAQLLGFLLLNIVLSLGAYW